MPLPRWLARLNQRVTNHLTSPLARWLPGFGVVIHQGRRTSRNYRTPVNVFRRPVGYRIALPYGRDAEWVRNVIAAGGCTLETRGRTWQLTAPHVIHDERASWAPAILRPIPRLFRVWDFLELTRCP